MDKVIFVENDGSSKGSKVIRVSSSNYEQIDEIATKSSLKMSAVANKLISYALKHVDWDKK